MQENKEQVSLTAGIVVALGILLSKQTMLSLSCRPASWLQLYRVTEPNHCLYCCVPATCLFLRSVVLLGEPGVGKTAIVQGLAQRLTEGDVPESLRASKLIALELGLLMAGRSSQHKGSDLCAGSFGCLTVRRSDYILCCMGSNRWVC